MGAYLCKKKEIADSEWKKQNKAMSENPMYQFAHLEKGGRIKEAYESVTDEKEKKYAVEKLAREEIVSYLYKNGDGQIISHKEYNDWIKKKEKKVNYDENIEVETHEACWDLMKRGAMGETPLHLLYLMKQTEIAKILLDLYPKLALDFYEGAEYYGESSLHLAVVNGDLESVKILLEKGAWIHQRATGRFFLPKDQVKKRTDQTNYEGYAYYGEYPLAFAACLGYTDIYDYLIDKGADPNRKDSFGNTVLHMVVIADQMDMYKYVARHHKNSARCHEKNFAGLSPLTLACKLGRHNVFKEIIELDSEEYWWYGNIMCSAYPVQDLDSIGEEGKINPNSALMLILEGETDEHLDMLQGGVVRQLLDEKWKEFVKRDFYCLLVTALLYLLLLSVAVYTRPAGDLLAYSNSTDVGRFLCEIIIFLTSAGILLYVLYKVLIRDKIPSDNNNPREVENYTSWKEHYRSIWKSCKHAPGLTIYIISCFLLVLCLPMRIAGIRDVEDYLLIFAVPSAWFSLLFFARGIELTGPFVTMIYKMCVGDLFRFGIIYLIFLFGFAQAFYFLFDNLSTGVNNDSDTFADTLMTLFQMTLGEFKYRDFDVTRYSILTKFVFAAFMILVPILLLNMLIAMMGNTYQQVISKSEKEWRKQWAKMVVIIEKMFFNCDSKLKKYQGRYCGKMSSAPPSDDDADSSPPKKRKERRALIVIKAASKTKAKQRKVAIANWKKTGKEIIRQVKQQKKDGKRGSFELHRRRSAHSDEDGATFSLTVKQLAWEKDIDLSKGQSFTEDPELIKRKSQAQETVAMQDSNLPNGKSRTGHRDVKVPPGKPKTSPSDAKNVQADRVFLLTELMNLKEANYSESRELTQVEDPHPGTSWGSSVRSVNIHVTEGDGSTCSWDSSDSIHNPATGLLVSVPKASKTEGSVHSTSSSLKKTGHHVRFRKPSKKFSSDIEKSGDAVVNLDPPCDITHISESEI